MEEELIYTPLGLVSDFVGTKGRIGFKPGNILREDKKVQIHLLSDDRKTKVDALLSPTLSEMYRKKTLTTGDILALPLSINQKGYRSIHRVEEEIVWVDADDKKLTTTKVVDAPKVKHEDLIAL